MTTTPPFVFSWDTSGYADGLHILAARCTDLAGNWKEASVYVSVLNIIPAQAVIYVTVISHNEEPGQGRPDYTADRNYYLQNRALVKLLAETVTSKGGKYNFQSDWNYLKAVGLYDTGSVTNDTAGKNIVRWMKEDLGVEVDPHAHETQYNYADVAYLIEQLGVVPSKNVGGFLYDPPDNYQSWEKHINGLWGVIYPSYFWRADHLWGAATYLHQGNDDRSSGIWRPKDRYNFTTDDPNQRLLYIGGCLNNQQGVRQLLDDITAGRAPADGFYTATIMMIQDFMTSGSITQLGQFIDSLAGEVAAGKVRWATLTEMAQIWRTQYGAKPFRYDCGTGGGGDTQPPTATVTSPASGQVLSGTVTLSATATDNAGGIARIEFYIDSDTIPACTDEVGKPSGSSFTCTWNTATKPDGIHSIRAKAYDPSNNFAFSSSVSFTIQNGGGAQPIIWGSPFGFLDAPPRPSEYAELGNQWVSLGSWFWWQNVETTPRVYNWSAIGLTELQQMDALGVRVIPELRSVNPIYGTFFNVDEYPDGNVGAWESYVMALVEKFDGDGIDDLADAPTIKAYSFVHELSVRYWIPRPAQYAEMFDATYRAMKAACSDCVLFLPGTRLEDFQFQDEGAAADGWVVQVLRYLDAYATQFDDLGFNYHFWASTASPTDPYSEGTDYRLHKTYIEAIRHAYGRFGYVDQPIISRESGMTGIGPGETNRLGQPLRPNEPYQARYVAKIYALTASLGQKVLAWTTTVEYSSSPGEIFLHTGLIHNPANNGGLSYKKLGWFAYKKMVETLNGADWDNVATIIDGADNVYAYRFNVGGQYKYIIWWDYFNDPGYTLGSSKQAVLTGLSGTILTVTDLVPDYSDGSLVPGYDSAFTSSSVSIVNGTTTVTLQEDPLLLEPGGSVPPGPSTIPVHSLVTGSNFPDIVKLTRIVVDDTRRKAYFASSLSRYIGVIDTQTLEIVGIIDSTVDGFVSRMLFLNTGNGILYMFVIEQRQLFRIDPVSRAVSAPITAERAPAFDPFTNLLYISERPDKIRIYNDQLQAVDVITGVTAPGEIFIDAAQERLYVVNSAPPPQAGVTVYNLSTKQFIRKYNMPAGFDGLPKGIFVGGGRIYINSNTLKHSLSIIDEASGAGTYIPLSENGLQMETYGGRLFQMTGYPYYAGYLPNADGSYGVLEVRDAVTGSKVTEIQTDLETLYFDIDQSTGRLFYSSTGRGTIGIINLSNYSTIKKIDAATTMEDVVARLDDGSLYIRNRLGGSTIYRINPQTGTLTNTLIPGNWPTKILLDSARNRLYALSHYEAKVSVFDLSTDAKLFDIPLGTQRARTDALSNMAMNHTTGKLYAIMPELGTLTMVSADGSGSPLTVSINGYTPNPQGGGPGKLHIAVNESLNRAYVFITDANRLNIYDGTSLSLLTYSTIADFNQTATPLDMLFSDEAGGRLFVGPYILDALTGATMGQVPAGLKVIGMNPSRTRFYVMDFMTAGFYERILEYDSSFQTVFRQWDLSPITGVYSAFGFDFSRNRLYVGYFDRSILEVINLS